MMEADDSTHAHTRAQRFDYGHDDVKNNERGRGQERGCKPIPTRNGASLLLLYSASIKYIRHTLVG